VNAPSDATVNTAADRVAVAVTRCRTVARMSGGRFEEIATYLPGRRVLGVIIRATTPRPEVEVHVVGRYGPTMKQIFREVEAAVRSVLLNSSSADLRESNGCTSRAAGSSLRRFRPKLGRNFGLSCTSRAAGRPVLHEVSLVLSTSDRRVTCDRSQVSPNRRPAARRLQFLRKLRRNFLAGVLGRFPSGAESGRKKRGRSPSKSGPLAAAQSSRSSRASRRALAWSISRYSSSRRPTSQSRRMAVTTAVGESQSALSESSILTIS